MGVFDWVESGLVSHDVELPGYKGSFNVTLGDALIGAYGSRHTHILGPDIRLVTDPEDILAGMLPEKFDLLTALASGMGGSASFVYGTNLAATYVGPKVDIRRGPAWSKVSDNVFGSAKFDGPGGSKSVPSFLDLPVQVAVMGLSVLMVLTASALEIAAKITYPDHTEKFALASTIITPRLMALIKELEHSCTLAEFAELYLENAGKLGYLVLGPLAFVTSVVTIAAAIPVGLVVGTVACVKAAATSIAEAADA